MDIEYITKLIELISESKVDEIEIEEDGKKIRIAKSQPSGFVSPQTVYHVPPAALHSAMPQVLSPGQVGGLQQESAAPAKAAGPKLHEVRCPIVGTFYRAPSPDSPPFVQIGSAVAKGGPLCIVEAMKLMNEIESDVAGKIVEIRVENGQPVEYDQVLFLIEPA
jgi:acetyl-CoA carboxylase biotin carboxyl carrier protein